MEKKTENATVRIREASLRDIPPAETPPARRDTINHPAHYNTGDIEVIDAIEDWKLGFNLGNVVKYVARAGKKDPDKLIEDLRKARWYLDREIQKLGSR
jgi:hypothetical protein